MEEANYLVFHTLELFYSNWVLPTEENVGKILDARLVLELVFE